MSAFDPKRTSHNSASAQFKPDMRSTPAPRIRAALHIVATLGSEMRQGLPALIELAMSAFGPRGMRRRARLRLKDSGLFLRSWRLCLFENLASPLPRRKDVAFGLPRLSWRKPKPASEEGRKCGNGNGSELSSSAFA